MKERGITFKAWEVRAILEGRKTQFRRVVKPQFDVMNYPGSDAQFTNFRGKQWWFNSQTTHPGHISKACPYGQPGDRLWVKETWAWDGEITDHEEVLWKADSDYTIEERGGNSWLSPVQMPRWASRITLEIVSVRVERLQEIRGEDALKEGIEHIEVGTRFECFKNYVFKTAHPKHGTAITDEQHRIRGYSSACASYMSIWESINGPGSWYDNPWVWVVEFKEVKL
jgi:hypothetical protein